MNKFLKIIPSIGGLVVLMMPLTAIIMSLLLILGRQEDLLIASTALLAEMIIALILRLIEIIWSE